MLSSSNPNHIDIEIRNQTDFRTNEYSIELALFLVQWIYSFVLNIAIAFLIYNARNHMATPRSIVESREAEAPAYFGGSTSIASFGAMFRRGGVESIDLGAQSSFPPMNSTAPEAKEVLKSSNGSGGSTAFPTMPRKTFSNSSPFPTTPKRLVAFPPVIRSNSGGEGRKAGAGDGKEMGGMRMSPLQEEKDRSVMNRLA